MRLVKSLLAAALIAGTAPLLAAAPAAAAPMQGAMGLRNAVPSMTDTVQYRGWRGGGRYYGGRGYRRGYGWGAPVAGFAAGALIGGAIASQNAARADDAVEYCAQRFRSYDVGSGTYLGNDGYRHSCP
jgi:hypothetical protein